MKFNEALEAMESGHSLVRESWKAEDGSHAKYLVLLKGMEHVWQIMLKPSVNAGNHLFSREDYKADDWVLYA